MSASSIMHERNIASARAPAPAPPYPPTTATSVLPTSVLRPDAASAAAAVCSSTSNDASASDAAAPTQPPLLLQSTLYGGVPAEHLAINSAPTQHPRPMHWPRHRLPAQQGAPATLPASFEAAASATTSGAQQQEEAKRLRGSPTHRQIATGRAKILSTPQGWCTCPARWGMAAAMAKGAVATGAVATGAGWMRSEHGGSTAQSSCSCSPRQQQQQRQQQQGHEGHPQLRVLAAEQLR